ncbi:hypothetical protein FA15DRAFT_700877 [Coprinopsis marcescibilis]|uniref:Uncharacterized protein n=1 Tax=Coprinopsis marcescibilis TaxID=230819 RepID=A0A5C3L7E1_COPMA|nr:hypothetical protein FA15DRAFT_700877 [Coprinopsis marcescibilis]
MSRSSQPSQKCNKSKGSSQKQATSKKHKAPPPRVSAKGKRLLRLQKFLEEGADSDEEDSDLEDFMEAAAQALESSESSVEDEDEERVVRPAVGPLTAALKARITKVPAVGGKSIIQAAGQVAGLLHRMRHHYVTWKNVFFIQSCLDCGAYIDQDQQPIPLAKFKEINALEIQFFEFLCNSVPAFELELPALKARPLAMKALAKYLDMVVTSTRGTDIFRLKPASLTALNDWLTDSPFSSATVSSELAKANCGWRNLATAAAIVPQMQYAKFCEDPQSFCDDINNGRVSPPKANRLPMFCWDLSVYDAEVFDEGLFESPILFKAATLVLNGPSSTQSASSKAIIIKRGRSCFAVSQRITRITFEFIAYIVILVYWSFSDLTDFRQAEQGAFQYSMLYDTIVQQGKAEDDVSKRWIARLLETWSTHLLSPLPLQHTPDNNENTDNDMEESELDRLVALRMSRESASETQTRSQQPEDGPSTSSTDTPDERSATSSSSDNEGENDYNGMSSRPTSPPASSDAEPLTEDGDMDFASFRIPVTTGRYTKKTSKR